MMLVRGASRERELSFCAALGAVGGVGSSICSSKRSRWPSGGALSALVLFGFPAVAGWCMGLPIPEEMDFDAVGIAIVVWPVPAGERALRAVAGVRFSRPDLISAMKADAAAGTRDDSRASRRGHAAIGIAIPFPVIERRDARPVRTADFGSRPTDSGRPPADARWIGTEAASRSERFATISSRRAASRSRCRRHADRLRRSRSSRRRRDGRGVRHGAGHARRRKVPAKPSARRWFAAAIMPKTASRRRRRGDFRYRWPATVIRPRTDWRTAEVALEEGREQSSRLSA